MRYLLLSVLVVCMIGIMIPSAFAEITEEIFEKKKIAFLSSLEDLKLGYDHSPLTSGITEPYPFFHKDANIGGTAIEKYCWESCKFFPYWFEFDRDLAKEKGTTEAHYQLYKILGKYSPESPAKQVGDLRFYFGPTEWWNENADLMEDDTSSFENVFKVKIFLKVNYDLGYDAGSESGPDAHPLNVQFPWPCTGGHELVKYRNVGGPLYCIEWFATPLRILDPEFTIERHGTGPQFSEALSNDQKFNRWVPKPGQHSTTTGQGFQYDSDFWLWDSVNYAPLNENGKRENTILKGNKEIRVFNEPPASGYSTLTLIVTENFDTATIQKWEKCSGKLVLVDNACELPLTRLVLPSVTSQSDSNDIMVGLIMATVIIGVIVSIPLAIRARKKKPSITQSSPKKIEQKSSQKPAKKKETSSFCENCGKSLKPTAKFCGKCGTARS